MAGTDPSGQAWSTGYDDAAWTVLRATAHALNGGTALSQMFLQSARNYADAERASTASRADLDESGALLAGVPCFTRVGTPTQPPTANGSRGDDGPTGWWIVEHTVGYVWPTGTSTGCDRPDRCGRDAEARSAPARA
ncbi:hypothetical protein GCM10027265_23640 [Jatrophihabitans fulvus]